MKYLTPIRDRALSYFTVKNQQRFTLNWPQLGPGFAFFRQLSVRWQRLFIISTLSNHIIFYGTPVNLSYAWGFGSLAGISLIIQIVSGLFLSMFYIPHIELAFASIEFIMRDVHYGWFVRYVHSNGASMFFFVLYGHILRGLYYGSYIKPRELLWTTGVLLLLLTMATAFLGYVLPWGQMSFWGATVITSMVTVIPKAGQIIVEWLWGGFTVNNPTLNRFFTFHFFLPFVIVGTSFLHLILLHREGSSAPLSDSTGVDHIHFYPWFFVKDLFAFFVFLTVFVWLVCYAPDLLGDPNNYIMADRIHTPSRIVPEWYFLPFYAMLRSIPHKTIGILTMFSSLMILFLLPFINSSETKDSGSRVIFNILYFSILADILFLGWLGQRPIEDWYIAAGQIATIYYFVFFLFLLPASGFLESLFLHYKK